MRYTKYELITEIETQKLYFVQNINGIQNVGPVLVSSVRV